jgi:hypothetical protein
VFEEHYRLVGTWMISSTVHLGGLISEVENLSDMCIKSNLVGKVESDINAVLTSLSLPGGSSPILSNYCGSL